MNAGEYWCGLLLVNLWIPMLAVWLIDIYGMHTHHWQVRNAYNFHVLVILFIL